MIECQVACALSALRPDEWSDIERRRVEAHLETCPTCAAVAHDYAQQDRLIRAAPRLRLTNSQRDQLFSRIRRVRRRRATRLKITTILGTATATVVLIALVLGLFALFRGQDQPAVSVSSEPYPIGTDEVTISTSTPTFQPLPLRPSDVPSFEESVQVTLRIFSGRPNPIWTLSPAQSVELRWRLDQLTPSDQPFDERGRLGYAGFDLQLTDAKGQPVQRVGVLDGLVWVEAEDKVRLLADEGRALEHWLLETAAGHVEQDIIDVVRNELEATTIHIVQEGDTLLSIASHYGVSVQALADANDLDDHSFLQPGTVLRILVPVATLTPSAETVPVDEFAIYLVRQEIYGQDISKLDLSEIELEDTPILSSDDILAYNWETHEIALTDAAYGRIAQLEVLLAPGLPFVVCVGREPIYHAAFWSSASSAIYGGIVIDVLPALHKWPIRLQLGYPESPEFFKGEDLRADPRIFHALDRAGKISASQ